MADQARRGLIELTLLAARGEVPQLGHGPSLDPDERDRLERRARLLI